jgi:hypothetical protein
MRDSKGTGEEKKTHWDSYIQIHLDERGSHPLTTVRGLSRQWTQSNSKHEWLAEQSQSKWRLKTNAFSDSASGEEKQTWSADVEGRTQN